MTEMLPGWREGTAKKTIIDFVARVCREDSQEFVQQAERIAVFDNDGVLWSEQPFYFQGLFLFERLRELANQHPEWKTTQPFQAALEGDWQTLKGFGSKGLLDLAVVVLSGTTTDEYECIVRDWLTPTIVILD